MRKRLITFVAVVAALTLVTGCSGGSSGDKSTIRLAYADQIAGGIDPAVFYSVEGDDLMLATYETLLTYRPGTIELAPSLAKSWAVSPDGKAYTFHLQTGVTFHDGTPLNAEAVKKSFERAIAVKGGPSYMLTSVRRIDTPDPHTVVIHLSRPQSAFLDYNASMYGPKIVSPTAVAKHAVGNDHATKWLSQHEAGTGPYYLASYKPAGPFVLKRYDHYWGTPAKTETIEISVVPNIGDQILQLRSGQLDLLTHGIDPKQIPSLDSDPNIEVKQFTAAIRPVMMLNSTKPPFNDPKARAAFAADMDAAGAARQVYGAAAEQVRTVVPPILMPSADDPLPDPGPPAKAPTTRQITLGYTNVETDLRRLAEVMRQSLQSQGWNVKLQADSSDAQFGYETNPKKAPNAAISTFNPDAGHPATWLNPVYETASGLNLLGYSDRGLDTALESALATVNRDGATRLYSQVAQKAGASWYTTGIADKHDVIAARSNIGGFSHVPVYIWVVKLADLEKR